MLMSKTDTKKLTGNNLCDGNTVVCLLCFSFSLRSIMDSDLIKNFEYMLSL